MPELTDHELIQSCEEFVLQQQPAEAEPEPEWTGGLTITPATVADILHSNNDE